MSQDLFLPFLTDDQGRSLGINGGVVVTKPLPDPIDETPEGWEGNAVQYARNKEAGGAIASYIPNLLFYNEGAQILRNAYYTIGIKAVLFFIWLKLDETFGAGMIHKDWYKGVPDFSTFKDGYRGVQINISEGGMFKDVQANKTVPYEYAFANDQDTVSLLHDGTVIRQETNWLVTDGPQIDPGNGQHAVDLQIVSNESINSFDTASQVRRHFISNADLIANTQYFHKTGAIAETIEIEMDYSVLPTLATGISPNPSAGSRLLIRAFDDAGLATDAYILDSWGNTGSSVGFYNVYHNGHISTTITVPANRRLYMLMFLTLLGEIASGDTADEVVYWTYQISNNYFFRMKYNYLFKETIFDCFRVYDLGNKFARSMSHGRSGMVSNLLEPDQNLLVTCGDSIRGIPTAVFKGNFSQWNKSVFALKCTGWEIKKNQLKVESRYDYFIDSQIADLGDVKIPDIGFITPAVDYMYSQVSGGYPDTDTQSINGRFAFCIPTTYKTPLEEINNTYDCQSYYKADPIVMELIRINTYGKTTTDNSSDNDPFFIDAEKVYNDFNGTVEVMQLTDGLASIKLIGITGLGLMGGMRFKILYGYNIMSFKVNFATEEAGNTTIIVTATVNDETVDTTVVFMHYKLRRPSFVRIDGVPYAPTIYNISISPRRNLQNHLRWIGSGIEHKDDKYMTYQTTTKNDKVETEDAAGEIITEREDILVANMGRPVFRPHYFTSEAESPYDLRNLMETNSSGYFSFSADGTVYQGFTEDIKCNDTTLESQDYKLLATPNNNYSNRIES